MISSVLFYLTSRIRCYYLLFLFFVEKYGIENYIIQYLWRDTLLECNGLELFEIVKFLNYVSKQTVVIHFVFLRLWQYARLYEQNFLVSVIYLNLMIKYILK